MLVRPALLFVVSRFLIKKFGKNKSKRFYNEESWCRLKGVLNNNVVQALDNNVEYIVMGKGLGFQRGSESLLIRKRLKRLLFWKYRGSGGMVSCLCQFTWWWNAGLLNILTFAEAVLQTKFDPSFFIVLQTTYITLLKEIERVFLCRILWLGRFRKFYPREYEIGKQAFVWLPRI